MKELKIATKWEVKIKGKKRSIQLFDKDGNKLDGKGAKWGGDFYCSHNSLTSLEGAPEQNQRDAIMPKMEKSLNKKGFTIADGILMKVVSKKKGLMKVRRIGRKEILFVATDGKLNAHGKTAKEALEELAFKSASRDVSQYKGMKLTAKKTPEEWAFIYRAITGACRVGTEMFMDRRLKKQYTLSEILKETKGAFGHEKFKEVVQG